ncbi:MAG: ATP-binding protein [Vulcanimicrobiota bacterium]
MSNDLISALLTALKVSPENEPLRVQVVRELLKAQRFEEAVAESAPLKIGQHKGMVQLSAAYLSLSAGALDAARALYQDAVKIDHTLADPKLESQLNGAAARVVVTGSDREENKDEVENDNRQRITFADIGGMESLKEKIRLSILYPLQKPEIYAAYGKKIGGGLLLYGPPGCGKTHLARATAGELGANFYILSLNEVLSMWLGESEKQLANLFATARNNAPSVIFIDEVDALGGKRSDMQSHSTRAIVSQFLVEMDGMVSKNDKVMILGATNMPWNVDSALRRPGRFDKVLFVPPPDRPAREQVLGIHCKGRKLDGSVRLGDIAAKTDHFSGADLAHVVELATERALSEALKSGNMRDINNNDFQAALKETRASTMEWLRRAKNYVNFANQDGMYDDLDQYLEKARIR